MPCSCMAAACSGSSRTPSSAPWTAGCSVFTRPSMISGKPVSSDTSRTGDAGRSDRLRRAAGRDQLDAGLATAPRRTRPARSCRRPTAARGGPERDRAPDVLRSDGHAMGPFTSGVRRSCIIAATGNQAQDMHGKCKVLSATSKRSDSQRLHAVMTRADHLRAGQLPAHLLDFGRLEGEHDLRGCARTASPAKRSIPRPPARPRRS